MEITTVIGCRVQCSFCPQTLLMDTYKEKNHHDEITWGKPVMMSFETFKTCIDKLPRNIDIHFSGFAEPWLNPNCTDMLLYAHEQGHEIYVYSTLVGMKTEDAELIKHIPFGRFHIHLPDVQKYAKIAINTSYIALLEKLISSKINNLTFMTMGDLPPEILKILGIEFPQDMMIDRAGNLNIGQKVPKKYGPILCSAASKNGINLLDHNVLLPNGDVCMCCMDYGMKYVLGNLLSCDYESLFKSDAFQNILEKMNANDSDIMCRVCNVSVPAKKNTEETKLINDISTLTIDHKHILLLENLYKELLLRSIDDEGLNYYLPLLREEKISIDEIRKGIVGSFEYKSINRLISS